MWSLEVVPVDVAADGSMEFETIGEVGDIDQFVFDRPPEALDDNVVDGPAATVHADLNGAVFEDLEEFRGRELRSLVGVEDERLSPAESIAERIAAKGSFERVGKFPAENEAAVPVDDGRQVEEAVFHPNVSDIGAPDVIRRFDFDVAQEIRKDLVLGIALREPWLGIEGFESQNAAQALNALAVDFLSGGLAKQHGELAAAKRWMIEMDLVEQPEQSQIGLRFLRRRVVEGRPRERQQFALLADGKLPVLRFYASTFLLNGQGQIFF